MPLKYVSTLPLFTLVIVACQQTDKPADTSRCMDLSTQ